MLVVVALWPLYTVMVCIVWLCEPSAERRRDTIYRIWADYRRRIY